MTDQPAVSTPDKAPDLIGAASQTLAHARVTLDLVVKQVATRHFEPPTDYQVAMTRRLVQAFTSKVAKRYIALVEQLDDRLKSDSDIPPFSGDLDLVAAALARADEHWITGALRNPEEGAAGRLALGDNTEEAELILALLRATSRRLDAFGDPILSEDDVPYASLERLVWRIAATLRPIMEEQVGDVDAVDRVLSAAAKQLLGPRRRRAPTAAERFASRLIESDSSLFALLLAALGRAQLRLFAALIAVRLVVPSLDIMAALTQPERLALFLKAAKLSGRETANILLQLAGPLRLDDDRLIHIVEGYQLLHDDATTELVRQLRLNPHYRRAIFEHANEQRG